MIYQAMFNPLSEGNFLPKEQVDEMLKNRIEGPMATPEQDLFTCIENAISDGGLIMEVILVIAVAVFAYICFIAWRNAKTLVGIKQELYRLSSTVRREFIGDKSDLFRLLTDIQVKVDTKLDSDRKYRVETVIHANRHSALSAAQCAFSSMLIKEIKDGRNYRTPHDNKILNSFVVVYIEYLEKYSVVVDTNLMISDIRKQLQ